MAPKPRFTDGEKVLCFHGPLLYEAKCLRSQLKDKHMKYFIHYSGWNKNWDEWVPECRVLKYNETNLQKQKELAKTHMKVKKPKSVKIAVKKEVDKETTTQPIVIEKPPKPKTEKKLSVSSLPEQIIEIPIEVKKKKSRVEPRFVEDVPSNVEIKVDIPEPLSQWLVDDWDLITRQKKILQLPARIAVENVICTYISEKLSAKGLSQTMESTIVEFANKIRDTFNILLGKYLLYKFERQQYAEHLPRLLLSDDPRTSMCQIYGAIHLLRMFTKIGTWLTQISASETDLTSISGLLNDFTKYMAVNSNKFFSLEDYVVASPEYHRRAL